MWASDCRHKTMWRVNYEFPLYSIDLPYLRLNRETLHNPPPIHRNSPKRRLGWPTTVLQLRRPKITDRKVSAPFNFGQLSGRRRNTDRMPQEIV
jgi:hypothetical protein